MHYHIKLRLYYCVIVIGGKRQAIPTEESCLDVCSLCSSSGKSFRQCHALLLVHS